MSNESDFTAQCESAGLSITFLFVPFSQSRSKAEKNPSLNWLFTLSRNGRPIISGGDYMQGCGHAPAYNKPIPSRHGKCSDRFARQVKDARVRRECETGMVDPDGHFEVAKKKIKPPTLGDVMGSLLLDSSVIDSGTFEDWATDCGYDTDSRTAEKIYNACLQTALALRAALGDGLMRELSDLANEL